MNASRTPLVAINGLFLDHPKTGTGVYSRELIARLLAPGGDDALRYTVIGHPEHRDAVGTSAMAGGYVALQAPLRRRSDKAEKVLWEQAALPAAVARLRADLLYAPYFSLPLRANARTVVTIHDLIPLLLPAYTPSSAFKAYFKLVAAATRRADAVVTDSQHSAADVARLLDVPRERIQVIYLGVDPRYGQGVSAAALADVRARLRLPDHFILYLGGTDPRKNVPLLLRALKVLQDRGQRPLPLVIVAPHGSRFGDPRDEAARLGVTPDATFLDWIDEADKPALYKAATAFVYPSRYEGFGLPPLEAMASGTPVISSNSSSLPEVVGDAGVLLDPDDVEGWADALLRLGEDEALRRDLAERGRAQAARFRWDETVDQLRRVFRAVLLA